MGARPGARVDEHAHTHTHAAPPSSPPRLRLPLSSAQALREAAALPFQRKLQWFRHQARSLQIPWAQGHTKVRVRRTYLLQDAYDAFRQLKPGDFRKIFKFEFINEPALDAGGVLRSSEAHDRVCSSCGERSASPPRASNATYWT